MSVRYLLPCSCGQCVVIQPRQAGERVQCSCGAWLQVPTLLGMNSLDPAPEEDEEQGVADATSTSWGIYQAMVFVGAATLALSLVLAIVLLKNQPTSHYLMVDPERVRVEAKTFSPPQTLVIWEEFLQGLDRHQDQDYITESQKHRLKWLAVGVIAFFGIGLVAAGAVLGRK